MRLIFMGTPEFACVALEALLRAGHEIAAVYTQPSRPAGRGQRAQRSPVHELAAAQGLEVRTPARLRDAAAQADFAALTADAAIVVAYGLILPRPILEAPRLGCINIHASLLPRWRGAAPIQRAILAGDAETGVTLMRMDEGLDTGPMLMREAIAIGPRMNAGALHDALAAIGARLVVAALASLERGALAPTPQPAEGVSYAAKIAKDEARLDWRLAADQLARIVRAFSPWPGAFCELAGERVKVLDAEAIARDGEAGVALDDGLTIGCGVGALRLLRVQRPGRGAMSAAEFLRGRAVPAGTRLG
jgi:methionyl-tRNA formyltransferase